MLSTYTPELGDAPVMRGAVLAVSDLDSDDSVRKRSMCV